MIDSIALDGFHLTERKKKNFLSQQSVPVPRRGGGHSLSKAVVLEKAPSDIGATPVGLSQWTGPTISQLSYKLSSPRGNQGAGRMKKYKIGAGRLKRF